MVYFWNQQLGKVKKTSSSMTRNEEDELSDICFKMHIFQSHTTFTNLFTQTKVNKCNVEIQKYDFSVKITNRKNSIFYS